MSIRRRALMAAAVAAAAVALAARTAPAGITVSPLKQDVTVKPGGTATFHVTVSNRARTRGAPAQSARLRVADFEVSERGAVLLKPPGSAPDSAADWITPTQAAVTLKPNQDCKRIEFSMGVNGQYTVPKSTGGITLYKKRYSWTNFTGGQEFEHTLRNVAFDALATSTSATLKFRLQQTSTGTISDIEDAEDGDLTSDKLTMRVRPYSQTTGGVIGDQRVLELAPLKRQTSSLEASDGTNTYWGGSLNVGSGITLGISTGGGPQLASFGGFTETASSVTAGASDLYLVSSSAAARTVTLPSTPTFRRITVKKIDSSTNAVIVAPGAASQTVDGSTSGTTLGTQYDSVTVVNNSTESPMGWYII